MDNRKSLDLSQPILKLERIDSQDLRNKILDLSYTEWKEMPEFESLYTQFLG